MRLLSMHVAGFGRICDAQWSSLNPRVNVFLGPNEAGKTTLLNFVHAMLAGFPRKWRQHYVPVTNVDHGGSLQFRVATGDVYVVRRTAAANGGCLELERGGHPVSDPEAELARLLGDMSPETFRQIYTFGVDELHDLRLLQAKEISARVYSAGLGVPRLPPLLRRLQDERENIFTARARARPIIEARDRIEEISRQLHTLRDAQLEHEQGSQKLDATELRISGIDQLLASRHAEQNDVNRLVGGYPIWTEMVELERLLSDLPVVEPVAPEDLQRVEAASALVADLRKELQLLSDRASALQEVSPSDVEAAALEHQESIEQLFAGRDSLQKAEQELATKSEKLSRLAARKDELLGLLGTEWSESTVAEFPATDQLREEVLAFHARFSQVTTPVTEATAELASAKHRADDARDALQRIDVDLAALPATPAGESMARTKSAIREGRRAIDDLKRVRDQRALLRYGVRTPSAADGGRFTIAAFWICVASAVLAIAVGVASSGTIRIGAFAVALLLGIVAVIFRTRRSQTAAVVPTNSTDDELSRSLSDEEEKLRAIVARLSGELGVRELTYEGLDAAEDALSELERAVHVRADLTTRRIDAGRLAEHSQEAVSSVSGQFEALQLQRKDLAVQWERLRTKSGIPAAETPESAVRFIERVRAAGDAVREWRSAARDLAEQQDALRTRTGDLNRLLTTLGLPAQETQAEGVDAIYRLLNSARTVSARQKSVEEQRRTLNENLVAKARDLSSAEEGLLALLRSLGAETADGVRERAGRAQKRAQAEARLCQMQATFKNTAGTREGFEGLLQRLAPVSTASLRERAAGIAQEISSLHEERDHLRDERLSIGSRLAEIEKLDCTTELLDEQEQLIARIQTLTREWLVRTIAVSLLEETKSIYERERKPKIIENAEVFFSRATGGTYPNIAAPTASTELVVFRHDHSAVAPENLSRGTLEQLYFALRLGFIRQLAEQRITPPVVVDEILVNPDPTRAARIADALFDLSGTNQVLVFTCHPWVAELFRPSQRPQDVKVIRLEECG